MEPRKSIRDISSSNSSPKIISDIVSEQPVSKKNKKMGEMKNEPVQYSVPNVDMNQHEAIGDIYTATPTQKPQRSIFKKIRNMIAHTRPVYIIGFLLILILILVLVLIPSPVSRDPIEQAKLEAEVVKKQLSKHIVLPENEQIDIRKITSKMEDPFFQNAEIDVCPHLAVV